MKLISSTARGISPKYTFMHAYSEKIFLKGKISYICLFVQIVTFLECQFVMVLKSHNIAEKALVYLHIPIYFKGKVVAQELLGSL